MARYCPHCGRDKHDPQHHERERIAMTPTPGPFGFRRGWVCRVRRLVDQTAPDLKTGERKVTRTYVPGPEVTTRLTKGADANNLRSVPVALLKLRGN